MQRRLFHWNLAIRFKLGEYGFSATAVITVRAKNARALPKFRVRDSSSV
jgi:hypothetical protein